MRRVNERKKKQTQQQQQAFPLINKFIICSVCCVLCALCRNANSNSPDGWILRVQGTRTHSVFLSRCDNAIDWQCASALCVLSLGRKKTNEHPEWRRKLPDNSIGIRCGLNYTSRSRIQYTHCRRRRHRHRHHRYGWLRTDGWCWASFALSPIYIKTERENELRLCAHTMSDLCSGKKQNVLPGIGNLSEWYTSENNNSPAEKKKDKTI